MAGRQLHKLSARKVETIAKPGRHSDGGGLYLAIDTGERSRRAWVFMYRERGTGRRRELGLGSAKGPNRVGLTLADARTKAADARKMLALGKDPKKEREVERGCDETFGSFADVTLVGATPDGKKLINSNVAIEYGHAHRALGARRVLMVQNLHYGDGDALPFDRGKNPGRFITRWRPAPPRRRSRRSATS